MPRVPCCGGMTGRRAKQATGTVKLTPADAFDLIRWLARSQSDPRKAVAELVQNAIDARARTIVLERRRRGRRAALVVRDDGQGFEPNKPRDAIRSGHIGLASIGERATAAGGDVKVNAQPGTGTTVTIRLPVRPRYRATGGSRGRVIPASRGA